MRPEDVDPMLPKAPPRRAPVTLDRGTCVGRYVILDGLGYGGMGVVYRAFDPDLDRPVALKLVRAVTAETTARLIREAKALAKVSHPNIVQIFDVGVFGETVFIAMELVEGPTLLHWNRETRPGWRVLLAQLIEAGRGLAAAHAAGLVHRDFKPQNAMVGADGRVRVLDFGLARQAVTPSGEMGQEIDADSAAVDDPDADDSADSTDLAVTRRAPEASAVTELADPGLPRVVVSRITGTPAYMAPEQRRQKVLDARADQFAYAVTCWELLHGERPFVGDNLAQYAESTATGRFRSPPAGNATPSWVRRVLLRALAAAPSDRYRSMDDLLTALAADPARRRRKVASFALLALAITGGSMAFAMRGREPPPCEDAARHLEGVWDPAVAARLDQAFRATGASYAPETIGKLGAALDKRSEAWTTMHREACRATRITGEQSAALLDLRMSCLARRRDELHALLDQLVTSTDAARVAASVEAVGQLPSVATCADRDALTSVVPMPDDPMKRAALDDARGELSTITALLLTGQWLDARTRAERIQGRVRQLGWAPLIAEAGLQRALAERHAGSFPAAEAALNEAVQAAARAHLDDVSASAWSELAWVIGYEEERSVEGLALAGAAEAMALRAGASPLAIAEVAHVRALMLSNKGDQPAALREAERAFALIEKQPDAGELEAVDVLNTIAMIRSAQGDYPRAEQAHRQVLERRRAALGNGHPKVADSLDNLGVVRFHQGAYGEARRDYEQALGMRVAALGAGHRDVGTSHNNLGGLLMETGDEKGAAKHLEAALEIYEATLGADHGDLAIPLSNLGELASRRGDHALAIRYCERALRLDEATGPDDPKLAFDLVCVGEAQLGIRDPRQARAPLERALVLRETSEGDVGELARTRFDLARALWGGGAAADRTRARSLATSARDGFAGAGEAWKARHAEAVAWLVAPH